MYCPILAICKNTTFFQFYKNFLPTYIKFFPSYLTIFFTPQNPKS